MPTGGLMTRFSSSLSTLASRSFLPDTTLRFWPVSLTLSNVFTDYVIDREFVFYELLLDDISLADATLSRELPYPWIGSFSTGFTGLVRSTFITLTGEFTLSSSSLK